MPPANTQKLGAEIAPFKRIFGRDYQLVCPFFQRSYAWRPTEIDQFLDDVANLDPAGADEHYLGAVIVAHYGGGFTDVQRWLIIDGQQRLTTTFLCILALAELRLEGAVASGDKSGAKAAARVVETYLKVGDGYQSQGCPRIQPTAFDFSQWRTLAGWIEANSRNEAQGAAVLAFAADFVAPNGPDAGRLTRAYTRIKRYYVNRLHSQPPRAAEVDDLLFVLLNRLKVVWVEIPEQADPYQVFNDLNTRGLPLRPQELAKVSIFKRFTPAQVEEAQAFADNQWRRLETELPDDLLDEFLFPYALCLNPSIQKKALILGLEKQWDGMTPAQVVDDIQRFVPAFRLITEPDLDRSAYTPSAELQERIRAIAMLRPTRSTYPYLMQVVRQALAEKAFVVTACQLLLAVESFMVRRAYTREEPTGLHALFKNLWETKYARKRTGLREAVVKTATIKWVSDEEFGEAIRAEDLYRKSVGPFVVREFERSRVGDLSHLIDVAQIEHIVPSTIEDTKWTAIFPNSAAHDAAKNLWGNLVLLSDRGKASNQAAGQELWPQKKAIYEKSAFLSPREIAAEVDVWDLDAIAERSEQLVTWAIERWPEVPPEASAARKGKSKTPSPVRRLNTASPD